MKGLMNEIYLDDLRDKTRRGLKGAALRGASVGGRAYGYKSEPVVDGIGKVTSFKVVLHPEHAQVVKRIHKWYADGKSPQWIAGELNRLKIPSPRGAMGPEGAAHRWQVDVFGHRGRSQARGRDFEQ
jgi:DNA invertase Pin-like site-specific DNA recombinase